ncbi:hypothetical protein ADL01_03545 [Streptomyces sp. NRRL WC-3618]|uniref:hypothetical protein n=1 Tax=Streptomyces sp. NRRL WC-3618 TaxID=1519490 RepID=UPI0006B05746|nr:hypothetical protein [Streptomyces sp. NRRL WC-3618]KOV87768.1 hypothetical protein ADL01_03545 [Streptomyces sp. NRRL WC-3618]
MSARDHTKILGHLRKQAMECQARIVKSVEIQAGKDGSYAVPFSGAGKGFSPRDVGELLTLFSSTPWELYKLVSVVMEADESGEVREAVTADLIEWHEGETVDV